MILAFLNFSHGNFRLHLHLVARLNYFQSPLKKCLFEGCSYNHITIAVENTHDGVSYAVKIAPLTTRALQAEVPNPLNITPYTSFVTLFLKRFIISLYLL
ncbi:hypothetical protein HanRHA438_Chr07g0292531 [Helianthus annuus]|uniref:Uncharacterized protein n=1 Tax=Helianthus annuus TaxID=4232 RepID=A0A9K3IIB2_HELAN|nr:hypothetical protein HanXRQr2_Chr07g0281931 [Helianthus annuus]KAJ0730406.1 hypothetical protein HanOQP8_Chr07g0239631 [Helianthus annuus]KAJ0906897.1 hypothetical protein HanRHA438_Chr07g0292531 [Helianthus annuus]